MLAVAYPRRFHPSVTVTLRSRSLASCSNRPLPTISATGLNGEVAASRSGMMTGTIPPGPARASGK